jgi:uncharacterized protein YjbI with pentapeptide repeats
VEAITKEKLDHGKFFKKDLSGLDLSGQDLSKSDFICCNFRDTNLSNANCSYCDFTGSVLDRTKCTHTNFMESKLACLFRPSDAYGMTLTLACRTFKGMVISKMWWIGFIYFAMLMKPEDDHGKDLRDGIISLLGTERYLRVKALFSTREI